MPNVRTDVGATSGPDGADAVTRPVGAADGAVDAPVRSHAGADAHAHLAGGRAAPRRRTVAPAPVVLAPLRTARVAATGTADARGSRSSVASMDERADG